jgi:hypothetical protein
MKEIKIVIHEDEQIKAILFPKDKPNSVDIIKLELTQVEGEKQVSFMTPDEALEIAQILTLATQFYLYQGNKEYKKLLKEKVKMVKKRLITIK